MIIKTEGLVMEQFKWNRIETLKTMPWYMDLWYMTENVAGHTRKNVLLNKLSWHTWVFTYVKK